MDTWKPELHLGCHAWNAAHLVLLWGLMFVETRSLIGSELIGETRL